MNDAYSRRVPEPKTDGDIGEAEVSEPSDDSEAVPSDDEARFRAMAELLPSMVFETDATGANIWSSLAWVRYTGLGREQLAGAGWQAVIHPDDLATSHAAWPLARATGSEFVARSRVRRHDGTWRWHLVRAVPRCDATGRLLAWTGSAMDIDDIVRSQAALEEQEARSRFLLTLNERLRPLTDPVAIMEIATAALGAHLGVAQAGYAELEETPSHTVVRVHRDWNDGRLASVQGVWRLEDFGQPFVDAMKAGQSVAVADVALDARTSAPAVLAAYEAIRTVSYLDVPLTKHGRLVAMLFINHSQPRAWRGIEIELAEQVCERVWSAVERARAETALAASEAHLRAVLDALPVGVVIADAQGRLLRENAAHRALWGMEPQATNWEQYGDWAGFWPATGQRIAAHEWAMARALRHGEVVRDELVECQPFGGGPRRLYLNNAAPVRDAAGQVVGGVVVELDVTQRLQAQEQLSLSQELFATAFANNPAAIALSRLADGVLLDVNDTWLHLAGEDSREAVIGRPSTHLVPDAEDRRRFVAELQRTGTLHNWEQQLRRKNDESVVVQISAQVLTVQGERAILSTLVDVTERQQAQHQLRSLNATLEQRVGQRTAELADARDAAEAANRAKGAFLANMSHEIRTPMNAILGLAHLLTREDATPRQAEQLAKIEGAGQHLLSIINDILDLSRIEAGKLQLEARDFELPALLEQVRSIVGASAAAKGLTFEVDAGDVPARLRGDDTRVRQASLNYAGNAVKFTATGRITLRARLQDRHDARLLVRVEVEDTGVGVKPEQVARLFDAFEQADASTTREHGGTGLGLAITRRLAELMGGSAGAQARPGGGSIFWFTAWLEQGAGVPVPEAAFTRADAALRQRHAGARVLVAEDHPVNREVALALLRAVGLEVDFAEDGAAALEKVGQGRYDLVLMDMQMPVMDGLQAARALRLRQELQTLPVLAMTANAFGEDRAACLAAGMNDFVSKPVEPQTLYATLLKWLDFGGRNSS